MAKSVAMMKAMNQTVRAWYSEDLKKHDRLLELLDTYHKVRLETAQSKENYGDKLTWCLEHCRGKFRDLKYGDGMDWYFEREEDATLFALRWL
jgi:hypothetical protein